MKPALYYPEVLPEWFKLMGKHSHLNSDEVVALFKFKSVNALNTAIKNGSFPQPDDTLQSVVQKQLAKADPNDPAWARDIVAMSKIAQRAIWKKTTIVTEIRTRRSAHLNGND